MIDRRAVALPDRSLEAPAAVGGPVDAATAVAASSAEPAGPSTAAAPRPRLGALRGSLVVIWVGDVGAVAAAGAAAAVATGRASVLLVAYAVLVLALAGRRRTPITLRSSDDVGWIVASAAVAVLVLLPWLPSSLASAVGALTIACLCLSRATAYCVLRALRRRGVLVAGALLVGASETGILLERVLAAHPELGLRARGFVDGCPPLVEPPIPVIGRAEELAELVERAGAERVLVCFPVEDEDALVRALGATRDRGVDVCVVPRLGELARAIPRRHLDEAWGLTLVPMRGPVRSPARRAVKRTFDVVVAAALLVVLAVPLLAAGLWLRVRTGPRVLFRQRRVTGEGRTRTILKLRTLPEHDDHQTTWAVRDVGTTRFTRWLRVSHVDELPQLFNVLRGDMSLVGPRPERPFFFDRFRTEIPRYEHRASVPAGITGWAQVHGLHGDTSMRERVRFDKQYVETWSPWLDVVILARTIAGAVRPRRSHPR